MSNRRVTQHRQQREPNEGDLKSQVRSLRRQLARAQREIERLQGLKEPAAQPPPPEEKPRDPCPACGAELSHIRIPGGKQVSACATCQWRSAPTKT